MGLHSGGCKYQIWMKVIDSDKPTSLLQFVIEQHILDTDAGKQLS